METLKANVMWFKEIEDLGKFNFCFSANENINIVLISVVYETTIRISILVSLKTGNSEFGSVQSQKYAYQLIPML